MVLWDVAARKRLADDPLAVKEGNVKSVAFSPDGKTIAAGYRGDTAAAAAWCCGTWPRASAWRTTPSPVKEGYVTERGLQPRRQDHRGRIRRRRHGGGGVVLWDVAARKRLADDPLAREGGRRQSVAFSPDGKTIAAGYSGGVAVAAGWCCGTWPRASAWRTSPSP